MTSFLNHLMRRRLLIWVVTLLLIIGFAGTGSVILWSVRMNITYRAELIPETREGWDGSITAIIPAARFQSIQKGETVIVIPDGGGEIKGLIRSIFTGPEQVKLKISGNYQPEEKIQANITLRAERLIAAFLK